MAPPPRPIDGWTAPKPEPSTRSSLPMSSGMAPVAEPRWPPWPGRQGSCAPRQPPARPGWRYPACGWDRREGRR
jgi:hypothetical protein